MSTTKTTLTIESDYFSMTDALVELVHEMDKTVSTTLNAEIKDHNVIATIIGEADEIPLIKATIKSALPPSLRIIDITVADGEAGSADA